MCYINYSKKLSNVFISPTNGIKVKARVKATAKEEGKASEIEKFDGTDLGIRGCRLKIIFMGRNCISLF